MMARDTHEMRLERSELTAIRSSPCSKCGAHPPFLHGARCHPHRLVPSKGYVRGNVVALCPYCHANEHPNRAAFVRAASKGGRRVHEIHPDLARAKMRALNATLTPQDRVANGRKGGRTTARLYPEMMRERGRQAGLHLQHLHPGLAQSSGKKGGRSNAARKQKNGMTQAENLQWQAAQKERWNLPPAERSASLHRTWEQRRANGKVTESAKKGWATRRARKAIG